MTDAEKDANYQTVPGTQEYEIKYIETDQSTQPTEIEITDVPAQTIEIVEYKGDEKVKEYFPKDCNPKKLSDDKTEIARRQLELLNSLERKPKKKDPQPSTPLQPAPKQDQIQIVVRSDSGEETYQLSSDGNLSPDKVKNTPKPQPVTPIVLKNNPNLTSNILSKSDIEKRILDKVAKPLPKREDSIGTIEFPQELILSSELGELASPSRIIITDSQPQLESQELIDILEGKDQQVQFEIVDGSNIVVGYTDSSVKEEEVADYEIEMEMEGMESEIKEKKSKIVEREIAIRQIISLPKQKKGRNPRTTSPKTKTIQTLNQGKSNARKLVDSLVSEWSDEKGDSDDQTSVTYDITNSANGEISVVTPAPAKSDVKILNKEAQKESVKASHSGPPKILNKNAPKAVKILNKEAYKKPENTPQKTVETPPIEAPPFKRQRVIKKKTIWDPSDVSSLASPDRKSTATPEPKATKLPPGISIKKITSTKSTKQKEVEEKSEEPEKPKETKKVQEEEKPVEAEKPEEASAKKEVATESSESEEEELIQEEKPTGRRRKIRSEIDKLLGDEGAVNMIYSLERENNNSEVPEIEVKPNKKSLINLNKEKNVLITKAKAIRNVVLKQSTSPGATPVQRARAKKETTPVADTEIKSPTKPVKKVGAKKKKAQDASSGWDPSFYSQCEDSMIIRRRSNSSYDSSAATSPRRLSVDQSGSGSAQESPQPKREKFEFVKPTEKNQTTEDKILTPNLIAEMKGKLNKAIKKGKDETEAPKNNRKRPQTSVSEESNSPPNKMRAKDRKTGELQVQKFEDFVHIELAPASDGKLKDVLTIELMNEMRTLLGQLRTDASCKVVLVTSASETFSNGLDFSSLVQNTITDRKQAASDVATAVKNFLISLVTFPKILICGVNGPAKNLAVTMLTLFDVVCATEKATFKTDYGNIGQIPEGLSLMSITGKVRGSTISQLLYLGETLSAEEAKHQGLVTKVLPADKFQEHLLDYCKTTSAMSVQYLETTKALLNEDLLDSIDTYLNSEIKTLQQQWISTECQEKFKNLLTKEE